MSLVKPRLRSGRGKTLPIAYGQVRVSAVPLSLKTFTASVQVIPTGVKTYPATYAHGYLTFSNGSVIGQSVPTGFTIDNVSTTYAVYVPPATPNGFGVVTIAARMLTSGANLSTLAINQVIGSSLFIRNLSPFTGGRPAYSVPFVTSQDSQKSLDSARFMLENWVFKDGLHYPCRESKNLDTQKLDVTWRCQFVSYKVPSYTHVLAARLSGKEFVLDVAFIAPPRLIWAK